MTRSSATAISESGSPYERSRTHASSAMTTTLTKPGSSALRRRSMTSVALADWAGSSCARCRTRTFVSIPIISPPLPSWRSLARSGDHGFRHIIDAHASAPRLDDAAQCRSWQLRQEHHRAVRMNEELYPIARLEPEVIPDRLRNGRLSLDGDRGFHGVPPLLHQKCNTSLRRGQDRRGVGTPPGRKTSDQLPVALLREIPLLCADAVKSRKSFAKSI